MIGNLGSPMHFMGVFDELPATTNYSSGDVVAVGNSEYVLVVDEETGTKSWVELGDVQGAMAYANTASTEYQPAGEISKPGVNLSGNGASVALSMDALTSTGSYTPEAALEKDAGGVQIEGSVSGEFEGQTLTSTGAYTPAGSLTNLTFIGDQATLTVDGQTITSTGVFTPDVTIDAHSITSSTFSGTTATISVAAELPALVQGNKTTTPVLASGSLSGGEITYDKLIITPPANNDETMVFSYSSITAALSGIQFNGVTTSVMSDVAAPSYSANDMSGKTLTSTGDYQPAGSVSVAIADHTLTIPQNQTISVQGEAADRTVVYTPEGTVTGGFEGTAATITVTGTPAGSLTNITFTGEKYKITGTAATISVSGTPTGVVDLTGISAELDSTPTFVGTTATIVVEPDPVAAP